MKVRCGPSIYETFKKTMKAREKREREKLLRMRTIGVLVDQGHINPDDLYEPYVIDDVKIWPERLAKLRRELEE